jgi:hypothetical protein
VLISHLDFKTIFFIGQNKVFMHLLHFFKSCIKSHGLHQSYWVMDIGPWFMYNSTPIIAQPQDTLGWEPLWTRLMLLLISRWLVLRVLYNKNRNPYHKWGLDYPKFRDLMRIEFPKWRDLIRIRPPKFRSVVSHFVMLLISHFLILL